MFSVCTDHMQRGVLSHHTRCGYSMHKRDTETESWVKRCRTIICICQISMAIQHETELFPCLALRAESP